jgi:hypothetical protein
MPFEGDRLPVRHGGEESVVLKPRLARQGYVAFLGLKDLDGRTKAAARLKQLIGALEVDLGGADRLSTAQSLLVTRAAVLAVQCEDFEMRFVAGRPVELTDYFTCVNVSRRVLATLGLERRARDVSAQPSLREYLSAGHDQAGDAGVLEGELAGEPEGAPVTQRGSPVAGNGSGACQVPGEATP